VTTTTDTTTYPVAPSVPAGTVERILFNLVDAGTLSQMAWLKRVQEPRQVVRRNLTPEGVDALAGILERGSVPTVGFFRRHCA